LSCSPLSDAVGTHCHVVSTAWHTFYNHNTNLLAVSLATHSTHTAKLLIALVIEDFMSKPTSMPTQPIVFPTLHTTKSWSKEAGASYFFFVFSVFTCCS